MYALMSYRSGPLQIILAVAFLYVQLGWSVFVGIGLMLILTFPTNLKIATWVKETQQVGG
jgi:hypothetical protein